LPSGIASATTSDAKGRQGIAEGFGEETAKTQPDIVAGMKKINAMRKVVSDSLYEKLTP
jgi:hypothetical protein